MRLVCVALLVLGCTTACISSAERELLQRRIAFHESAIGHAATTLNLLKANNGQPGPHQFRAFVSTDSVNLAIGALRGRKLSLDGGVEVELRNLNLTRYGPRPAIKIDAIARRGRIELSVEGLAVLTKTLDPAELRLELQSLIPTAKWRSIEVSKVKLVRDLIALKLDEQVQQKMPVIRLPLERSLTFGGPARTNQTTVITSRPPESDGSNLSFNITVDSTQWSPKIKNFDHHFTAQGLWLFGDLE